MKKLLSVLLTLSIVTTLFAGMTLNVSAAVNAHDLLFDWEYYYNHNSDLQRAFGKNQSKLRQHYNNYGKKEGRAPSEFFDPKVYLGLYGDLRNAFGSTNYVAAYNHFVSYGINEQRQASNTFNLSVYKSNYEDLRKAYGNNHIMYIYHYKTYGKKEGRNAIKRITQASNKNNTNNTNNTNNSSNTAVTNLENGGYYIINYKNTQMGINAQFAPKSGIGNLVLDSTSKNPEGNEIWKFTYNSSYKAYYITPQYRSGAAINALYGAKAQKGSQAKLHDSNINDTASLWRIEKSGNYYRFKNVASGYYLDVASGRTSTGTKINIWQNAPSTQQFSLKKVSVTPAKQTQSNQSWQYPMSGYSVSQKWNNYSNTMAKKDRPYHSGIDMVSSKKDIYAVADGTVVYKGYTSGNGYHVILSHKLNNTTVKTLYSHLSSYSDCPAEGQKVTKGRKIGVMGSTGNSTGPHLHFAVFTGSSIDPYGYVKSSNSNRKSYGGCVFYNPDYVIKYNKLP